MGLSISAPVCRKAMGGRTAAALKNDAASSSSAHVTRSSANVSESSCTWRATGMKAADVLRLGRIRALNSKSNVLQHEAPSLIVDFFFIFV